jgi:hypothetical protein
VMSIGLDSKKALGQASYLGHQRCFLERCFDFDSTWVIC